MKVALSTGPIDAWKSHIRGLTALNWSYQGTWLSVTDVHGHSDLYNATTHARRAVAPGWNALCWRPDAMSLIVAKGHQLGTVNLLDPSTVKPLATLPQIAYQRSWSATPVR